MTYKYRPKSPYVAAYIVIIGVGALLTIGRWFSVFNHDFVIINAEVHSHISNLSISLIAYAGIGYAWLLFGTKFRYIVVLGVLFIAGNFVCETVMTFLNTTDLLDAVYGTVGVLLVFPYLLLTKRYGLVERSPGKR